MPIINFLQANQYPMLTRLSFTYFWIRVETSEKPCRKSSWLFVEMNTSLKFFYRVRNFTRNWKISDNEPRSFE